MHLPGETECFECTEKPTPKQYPICTLASTPNKPIHLVHWAKMVYETFFGVPDPENALNYLSEGSEDERKEEDFRPLKAAAATGGEEPDGGSGLSASRVAWAREVYTRCFHSETERLLTLDSLWVDEDGNQKRRKPVPVDVGSALGVEPSQPIPLEMFSELDVLDDQQQMTRRQASLTFLKSAALLQGSANRGFDKDDPAACDFVIAACNLRGECFHMDALTPFKAKAMAGNIIAAIASTNAIIGAMIGATPELPACVMVASSMIARLFCWEKHSLSVCSARAAGISAGGNQGPLVSLHRRYAVQVHQP